MKNNTAFCGLDCSVCPAYIATQANDREGLKKTAETWSGQFGITIKPEDCICDGCQPEEGARMGGYCGECPIRACSIKKGYPNCAYCPDYACGDLKKFYGGASVAKGALDSIRNQINKA